MPQNINMDNITNFGQFKDGPDSGAATHREYWPEPILTEDDRLYSTMHLIDHSRDDALSNLAKEVAAQVQFPESSVYLHGLGCVAAAMCKSFYVNYFGELSTNLYIATAQPPSTGKTGVSNFFTSPILAATEELNAGNMKRRREILQDIEEAEKELKSSTGREEKMNLRDTIVELEEKLSRYPIYQMYFTDATPEALCNEAAKQTGMFNIISDEAQSILTSIGLAYGDSKKAPNNEPILKGWDNGYVSMVRITRSMPSIHIRGGIAVLAQYETVKAILSMSDRENGLTERFLFGYESHMLGSRDHTQFKPVSSEVKTAFGEIMRNVIMSDKTVLNITEDSKKFILQKKNEFEPMMADGGKYSSNLMRGFLGKMDKQVLKIAASLHAIDNFQHSVTKLTIGYDTVLRAYNIYCELLKTFTKTADSEGFGGDESQIKHIAGTLSGYVTKGKIEVKIRTLIDSIKKAKPFKSQTKITTHFNDKLMPVLQNRNICWYSDKNDGFIKINPKMAE
jgi:hypothetical protein